MAGNVNNSRDPSPNPSEQGRRAPEAQIQANQVNDQVVPNPVVQAPQNVVENGNFPVLEHLDPEVNEALRARIATLSNQVSGYQYSKELIDRVKIPQMNLMKFRGKVLLTVVNNAAETTFQLLLAALVVNGCSLKRIKARAGDLPDLKLASDLIDKLKMRQSLKEFDTTIAKEQQITPSRLLSSFPEQVLRILSIDGFSFLGKSDQKSKILASDLVLLGMKTGSGSSSQKLKILCYHLFFQWSFWKDFPKSNAHGKAFASWVDTQKSFIKTKMDSQNFNSVGQEARQQLFGLEYPDQLVVSVTGELMTTHMCSIGPIFDFKVRKDQNGQLTISDH